ncbi:hypothetical protein [Flexibacterium corallicola]|uniref:hypothetical protein n=1 Tax=Flexibacterium corallicola TaxID=3037259 RepID=UPI00286ED207|nr:hypothetical protein [Pseudovibrio sp. M1P-2-3]
MFKFYLASLLMIMAGPVEGFADTPSPITYCRSLFHTVVQQPDSNGGWIATTSNNENKLCLYGSLSDIDLAYFKKTITNIDKIDVIVRSSGGPVETWLTVAELLSHKVHELTVDELCFSSCANYIVPIARQITSGPNSLIAWHGGPYMPKSSRTDGFCSLADHNCLALARRTEVLYKKHNISSDLLRVSGTVPHHKKYRSLISTLANMQLLDSSMPLPVAGYAFSPDRLKAYGIHSTSRMWHAGADIDIALLSLRRNQNLLLMESP